MKEPVNHTLVIVVDINGLLDKKYLYLQLKKMIGPTLIALIISAIALETLSQFMARLYYENKNKLYLAFIAWALYLGVVFTLVSMYDYSKIAIANSLWDSGTIITLSLVGWLYFGEPLSTGEIIGICLVIAGAIVIGISTKEKDEEV